ncbi:MAG: inositol 2-dehydrogenase [Chitinophagaceae bacterium]|nr:inositol 2-dehydrogenase [Chitinophagaceae bacterium]
MKRKIALIGLGRMGKIHLRHLYQAIPDAVLVAVSDRFYERDKFVEEYPGIAFSNDSDEVLAQPEIDAVVICTPTSTHAELIEKALEAGKHIFCEKPLDLSLSVTIDLLKKAEKRGVKLMIGFNRRFDPDFSKARDSVTKNVIGDIQVIKITNRDPDLPPVGFIEHSGGMFMDFSIHDFDMARYISGKEVREVYARGMAFIDKRVEEAGDIDTCLINLVFEDDTYALIDNSRRAVYGYDQRIEIFGDKGMIAVENNLYNQNVIYTQSSISQALPLNNFSERYETSYLLELKGFVNALVKDAEFPILDKDIISATAVAYAARKSLKENRPVLVSEIMDEW